MKKIGKQIGIFILMTIAICMLSVHGKVDAASAKICMNRTRYVLPKGKRIKLKATILKTKYRKRKIRWSSSKKSVAKVSKTGIVLGRKKGTATITARISGTKYKATCKIYVGTPVSSIITPKDSCEIEVGKSYEIGATVLPKSATKKSLSYISSDEKIAKVSSGVVTALKPGIATITIVSKDGHDITKTFTVNVIEAKKEMDGANESSQPVKDGGEPSGGNPESGEETPEVYVLSENVLTFLQLMEKYSSFIKQNASLFQKNASGDVYVYAEAEKRVKAGNTVIVNCTTPMNWGLHEMGFLSSDKNIWGGPNGFNTHTSSLTSQGTFIKTGEAIGMGFPQAAKAGYLRPGDMVAICIGSSTNHSVVYAGLDANGNPLAYEAGGNAQNKGYAKVGCGPINYNSYTGYKITEIYRLN